MKVLVEVETTGPLSRFCIRLVDGPRLYVGLWANREPDEVVSVGIAIAEAKGWAVVAVKLP